MKKPLIVGYGNADRQDDGVAWHILRNLAEKLGQSIPSDPGAFIEIYHDTVDLIFILQIFPELAETISQYQRVCFVDAHTANISEEISWTELLPTYEKSPLTHHMSPKTVLSIAATIYESVPKAILVSIRGYEFEFERELSPQTATLADRATNLIWDWIKEEK